MTTPNEPHTPPLASSRYEYQADMHGSYRSRGKSMYSTPCSDVSHLSRLPPAAKDHIKKMAPSGAHCLITQQAEPVEYCHVLARASYKKSVSWIRKLEYAWGREDNTLNLDSCQNIMFLTPDLHTTFDSNNWAFLPCPETLAHITEVARNQLPGRKQREFQEVVPRENRVYQFCHFKGAPHEIFRLSRPRPLPHEPQSNERIYFAIHESPFQDFFVTSHIHPYFVICNVGLTFQALSEDPRFKALDPELQRRASECHGILLMWLGLRPEEVPLPLPQPESPTRNTRSGSLSNHTYTSHGQGSTQSRRRPRDSRTDDRNVPDNTHTDDGGSAKRRRRVSSSASVCSLQTPGASHGQGCVDLNARDLAKIDVQDSVSHLQDLRRWVEAARSGEFGADSTMADDEAKAKVALRGYDTEQSWQPPKTPWQQWKPAGRVTRSG